MRGSLFGFELLKFGTECCAKFFSPIFHYYLIIVFAIILRIYKIFPLILSKSTLLFKTHKIKTHE